MFRVYENSHREFPTEVKELATAQFINTQKQSQNTLSEYSTNIMYMLRLYGNMIVLTTKNRN